MLPMESMIGSVTRSGHFLAVRGDIYDSHTGDEVIDDVRVCDMPV